MQKKAHQVLRGRDEVVKLVLQALELKLDAVKACEDGVAHACAPAHWSAPGGQDACHPAPRRREPVSPDVPSCLTPLCVSTRLTISFCADPPASMPQVLAGLTRCGAVLASPLLELGVVLALPGLDETVAAGGASLPSARSRLTVPESALSPEESVLAGSTEADLETATVLAAGSVDVSVYWDAAVAGPLARLVSAATLPAAASASKAPSSRHLSCVMVSRLCNSAGPPWSTAPQPHRGSYEVSRAALVSLQARLSQLRRGSQTQHKRLFEIQANDEPRVGVIMLLTETWLKASQVYRLWLYIYELNIKQQRLVYQALVPQHKVERTLALPQDTTQSLWSTLRASYTGCKPGSTASHRHAATAAQLSAHRERQRPGPQRVHVIVWVAQLNRHDNAPYAAHLRRTLALSMHAACSGSPHCHGVQLGA